MKFWALFITICYLYPLITVAQTANTFALTGSLDTERAEHTATLLSNGKVLVAGGTNFSAHLASAEIYDSSTGTFGPAGSMNIERNRHSATLLANGQVLIAGGENVTGVLGTAELYDPSTGAFTVTGSLTSSRELHTATLLPDGKVLVVGGVGVGGATNTAELYDPATGTFTPTGAMSVPRAWHTATLLQNGKVIVTGGFAVVNGGGFTLDSAEIYDPSNGTFSPGGKMTANRQLHTASLLSNGKVLLAGGVELVAGFFSYTASAELYDPLTGLFTSTGGMTISHALHTATVLQNGQVLIAGGDSGCSAFGCAFVTAISELYDPSSGLFVSTANSMNTPRDRHTATLLVDGNVLVAGGANSGYLASAELFQPAAALSTGTISVSTNNPAATFIVSDGASNNFQGSGVSFTQVAPPGTYTITFGAIPEFITPDPQTQTLSSSGTVTFTGSYKPFIAPPTSLTAVVGNGTITLDWTPSQTQNVDGYNIDIEQFITDHFVSLGTVNAVDIPFPSTHFVVTGQFSEGVITNGTLYRFHVTAVKTGFESLPSDFTLARPGEFALSQLPSPPTIPILFLHGICLLSSDTDGAAYWKDTTDFLSNDLHWKNGGTLKYLASEDPRELPPATDDFVPGASFYTATFGNCKANYFVENPLTGQKTYFGRPGISHQADEVQGFVRALNASGMAKVDIVAHSMGGLAARSYIADSSDASTGVMNFVTYGTPHWGIPSVFLVSPVIDATADGARDLTASCDFNLIRLTSILDYGQSAFLEHLRQSVLPDQIRYINIRGQAFFDALHLSDLADCLSPFSDGVLTGLTDISVPLVPIDSADLVIPAHAPINQPIIVQKRTMITTDRSHTFQPSDFSAILCALDLNCVIYRTHSPVDIEITAPDGRMITRQLTEIPGAAYMETLEESGATSATVLLPFPLDGEYSVNVVPKPEAAATDSYGLDVTRAGITTVLAQDQSIQAIPSQPYAVNVLRSLTIDIKPGDEENKIELRDDGKITVAILSTARFDAPARVDTTTLSFGHSGDERSLAFCEKLGEDINGDGLADLVCHFFVKQADFVTNDAVGILKGTTKDGVPFVGTDSIRVISEGNQKN